MTYRILAVDGGGIRGLIPAQLLTYLEHDHGKRISDLFDLLVGTSTGGIICLGLAHPSALSSRDLMELYLRNASIIFDPKGTGTSLFSPKYDGEGLRNVLERAFGTTTLASATRPVCVTAFDLAGMCIHNFSSYGTPEISFVDAALATSAGPTFFPAEGGQYADGGVVANNPSLIGLSEAVSRGASIGGTAVLSLGTGRYDPSLRGLANGGQLNWAQHITDLTIDGVADRDARIAQVLLGDRYRRIQPTLTKELSPMDSTDPKVLAELQAISAQAYSDNQAALERFFT